MRGSSVKVIYEEAQKGGRCKISAAPESYKEDVIRVSQSYLLMTDREHNIDSRVCYR